MIWTFCIANAKKTPQTVNNICAAAAARRKRDNGTHSQNKLVLDAYDAQTQAGALVLYIAPAREPAQVAESARLYFVVFELALELLRLS